MALSNNKIITIAIGVFVAAVIIPSAITELFGANQTGWDASTIALWSLLPLVIVAFFVMKYAPRS